MEIDLEGLTPPVRLALAYTPKSVRASFAILLRLDARFAQIASNAKEPLIGQMKLAWWRDAIIGSSPARPKGEPLLNSLFEADNSILNDAGAALADAWEILITHDDWPAAIVGGFAKARGHAVFQGYADLSGLRDFPAELAGQWAADDLRLRFGEHVSGTPRPAFALPKERMFRPLTILAMSVRDDSGPRLIWHALTGR